MSVLTLELPAMTEVSEFEAKMILACELYEREKLSLGQAAKLVGISKRAFIETMGNYGYSIFGKNAEEIINDIRNA